MQDNASTFDEGLKLYHERNFADAEKVFRGLLIENSHDAKSLYMMAAIGYEVGRYDFAEQLMNMALAEEKDDPAFYFTLASIQLKQGKVEESLLNFQNVVNLRPDHIDALLQMAYICRDQGAKFRNPNMLEAALNFFHRALGIRADEDIYYNMGYILQLQGNNRGAIEVNKASLKRYPNSIRTLLGIAFLHDFIQEYEEALEYYQKALELEPNDGGHYTKMAATLKNLGRVEEAISLQRKALLLSPEKPWIYSNILLTMVYAASVQPEEIAEISRQFGKVITDPLLRKRPFANDKNVTRKIRIGYVSPDLRNHAVHSFLAPIYECDKKNFEIFAYSKNEIDDDVTNDLKKYFDHWRDIKYVTDDAAADIIEADKIDILVDVAGHTGANGLMIFARKPAPIQVTWLGYPATTGMNAMDYRITDSYTEPSGMTEHLNTETLWRLPDIFCAYREPERGPAVIDHPPFEDNGYITFGCFNNFTKVTDPVLDTWAKIMKAVPDCRLLIEVAGIESQKVLSELEARLMQHGLPLDRVILEPRKKSNQYVLYNKIDIALDPFPCNGGTTSMDTLWMGVPFVTLAGKHFVSRMGFSILTNAGLPHLIAQNIDDYISIAVDLAQNHKNLRQLRDGLRDRFFSSPAMDQIKFARNLESAYREMWKKWVNTESSENGD